MMNETMTAAIESADSGEIMSLTDAMPAAIKTATERSVSAKTCCFVKPRVTSCQFNK